LRDAFAVLFFVSVGMLFDPMTIINDPLPLLATLAIIIVGKSLAAFFIVLAFGYPTGTALIISASLAQIGEFSFILAELGVGLGMLPEEGRDLILGGAILSILLNPLVFAGVTHLKPWLEKRVPAPADARDETDAPKAEEAAVEEIRPTALTDHAVLIGYGRVGSLVGDALKEVGKPFLVIEDADKTVAKLRDDNIETIVGNAANGEILAAANLAEARQLILAIPNAFEAGQIVVKARAANPVIRILARAHSDAEVQHLLDLGADAVIMGEREIARGIVAHILNLDEPKPEGPLTET
ncbi:MAG: NAD-binding protein, partial [Phyllobacterium sp.]